MAHSLASRPPPATATTTPISTTKNNNTTTHFRSVGFQKVGACNQVSNAAGAIDNTILVHRRSVGLGLVGALVGLSFNGSEAGQSANAAARRPPPPPAEEKEKKDPNVSGVLAKVLASKKRKEAMKESVAKLRDKGKPVQSQTSDK